MKRKKCGFFSDQSGMEWVQNGGLGHKLITMGSIFLYKDVPRT